jgi:hypothetical protein
VASKLPLDAVSAAAAGGFPDKAIKFSLIPGMQRTIADMQ